MKCETCAHLDETEADTSHGTRLAGFCTRDGHYFNGVGVPDWMEGCPKHEQRAIPQADGDGGEA